MGGGFNSISPQLTGPAPAGVRRDDMDKEFRRFAGILQSRTSSFFVGSKAVDKVWLGSFKHLTFILPLINLSES